MSKLIVEVCRIDDILALPSSDNLEVAVIKGWRTVVSKGKYKVGSLCVYIPPDSILPTTLSDRIGVTKYLTPIPKDEQGNPSNSGRIRVARLRGQQSYGIAIYLDDPTWELGKDVAEILGITKYEPPLKCVDGDAERPHPAFHKYTDIENYRNFPDVIKDGEEVVFCEKLHGSNARLGLIREADESGVESFIYMCGSHDVRRKENMTIKKVIKDEMTKEPLLDENGQQQFKVRVCRSKFWDCLSDEIKSLLLDVSRFKHNVIVFGEMLGTQDMHYGVQFGFRAFDISVDGVYLDHEEKQRLFDKHKVPKVPILYCGPFSRSKVEEFVDGPTTMCSAKEAGPFTGREGIVITPVKERLDSTLGGRVILKGISFAYLNRKNGTEFH